MSPENKKPAKIPKFRFRPEGYVSPDDIEFLEQLIVFLRGLNFDPDQLIYSGTGVDQTLEQDGSLKRPNAVFAMNESGWVRAARGHENTPAGYAERWEQPCIALYDRQQLAEAYSYDLHQDEENHDAPITLTNITPGDSLANLPAGRPVEEVVIHKNYPNNQDASPVDALLGLVILDH